MIITLSRSGGFTGLPITKTIDTTKIPSETAERIEELVRTSQFFTVHHPEPTQPKPDQFIYRLTVEDEVVSQTLEIPEHTLTPEMKELIRYLESN